MSNAIAPEPETDSLNAIHRDLRAILDRMDALAAHMDPPEPAPLNVVALSRVKAVMWVLKETGEAMRPVEIAECLHALGRKDDNAQIAVTAGDLAKEGRIRKLGRGRYRA